MNLVQALQEQIAEYDAVQNALEDDVTAAEARIQLGLETLLASCTRDQLLEILQWLIRRGSTDRVLQAIRRCPLSGGTP